MEVEDRGTLPKETTVAPSASSRVNSHAIGLAFVLLGHVPMLVSYFKTLWQYEHYQFFPFALLALALLFRSRVEWSAIRITRCAAVLLLIDLALITASCIIGSPWITALAFAFGLAAVACSSIDNETETRPWELCLLYLSVVRPPAGYDVQLVQKLQLVTSSVSSDILDRIGVLHVRSGNLIELATKRLFVEEACSGVQSLFAIIFVALFVIASRRRPPLHALVLLMAAPLCALPMNVARVTGISLVWEYWQLDWSVGTSHAVMGYVLLFLAAGLVLSADKFIRLIGEPISELWLSDRGRKTANPIVRVWNWFWKSPAAVVEHSSYSGHWWPASLMVSAALVLAVWQSRALTASDVVPVSIGQVYGFAELPEAYGDFKFGTREVEERSLSANQGKYSDIWRYRSGSDEVVISCDYPFAGWHSLETCYIGIGWQVEEKAIVGTDWPAYAVTFSKVTGERAYLLYSLFDAVAEPLRPKSIDDPVAAVTERMMRRGNWNRQSWSTFQAQVFYEGPTADSPALRQKLLQLHQDSREDLRQHLLKEGVR